MVFDTDDDLAERQQKRAKRLDEQKRVDPDVVNAIVKLRLQFDKKTSASLCVCEQSTRSAAAYVLSR